jgi:hypothetical protein
MDERATQAKWTLDVNGPLMLVQKVYALYLKNPSLMAQQDPGLKADLDAAGLTAQDYQQILSADPFIQPGTAIDLKRYVRVTEQTYSYDPPPTAKDTPSISKYEQTNSATQTTEKKVEVDTKASVGLSTTVGSPAVVQAKLTLTDTFSWKNTNSQATSSGSTQSATFSVGGPAFGYHGPVDVVVYWDTVYNTFMFAFASDPTTQ